MRFELIDRSRPFRPCCPCYFTGGGGSSPPPPRDVYQETAGELQAKLDLQPQVVAGETAYRPQYNALDLQSLQSLLEGTQAGTTSRTYQATQFVPGHPAVFHPGGTIPQNGSAYGGYFDPAVPDSTQQVLRTQQIATPAQRGLLDLYQNDILPASNRIDAQSNTASRTADIGDVATLGPLAAQAFKNANPDQAALSDRLNAEARAELDAGANLDPSLAREVQQSVRAGQSARGMGLGLNDLSSEAYFSAMQADQLRRQRQAFASSVYGMNQQGVIDPFLATLGRPSLAPQQANQFVGQGFQQSRAAGPQLFGSQVNANDIFSSNFNAASANSIANNNASAAQNSALLGGGAAIGAAALIAL